MSALHLVTLTHFLLNVQENGRLDTKYDMMSTQTASGFNTTSIQNKTATPLPKSTQFILIDESRQSLKSLDDALREVGYTVYTFQSIDKALPYLSKADLLLIDAQAAAHPKSSKLIKAPTMLVLTDSATDRVPPWLEARHVFLVPYPEHPDDFVNDLGHYVTPALPNFGGGSADPEHLALLFSISQTLSGHFLDMNDLFEHILNLAPYLKAKFASLLIQEGDETVYYRSTQPGREELTGPAGRRFAQRLLQDGLEGWVLRHNQAVTLANTMTDSRWFRASYLPDQENCVVALPITLERVEARGVFQIGQHRVGHFTQKDLPLLKAVTHQISMAIENAMLFKNQSERSIQLSLINEVGQAATSILNLDAMLRTVVQAIHRSFAFYMVSIHLYHPPTKTVELRALAASDRYHPSGPANAPVTHKLREGLIGWTIAANKTILANDVTRDPRYLFDNSNREVRSELCVPITMGTKPIGVLDLRSTQLEAFDKYHVSALETLGDQLAIAIENARLYDKINQHIKELTSLNDIGQAITSTLDLQETLKLITNRTTRLLGVAAASVALRDDESREVWFAAASGEGSDFMPGLRLPLGKGLAGWVADQGQPVIVPDVYADNRFFAEVDKNSGFTTRSILCVPLKTKGRTIGAIEVMNKKNGQFNEEDQTLLQSLATSAATAIENAQLYEKQARTIKSLAETQNQLVQSAKLAAVGELAAGIAHEINNPLTTIIALTSLLSDTSTPSTPDERYEDLQMIHTESRRARDIVRSLLDFARADTPKRQPVDLSQLIEEAIFLVYTKSVSQKITLTKSLTPLAKMFLDANQIKQVFVNLLNNAIQTMLDNQERPAKLTVITTVETPQSLAVNGGVTGRAENKPAQPIVICQICDTGQGIKPEHLNKIFDPFFTTKEVGQGTGLGLSISYGIIKKHGGDITVTSTPGQGTTFRVKLPVYHTQPANDG